MLSLFNRPPYKIGVALSGGGARGFAHAGALMALEQSGLKPDIIAGVSAGSVVAAMYASGMHPRDILDSFSGVNFSSLTELRMPRGGLFSLDPFRAFLRRTIKVERLEDMPLPVVVGVSNFDTGQPEAFREGPVDEIIAASCSIPVVFRPAVINGYNYVDGGVLHNLPAWAIRQECRTLIGINCSPLRKRKSSYTGLMETALRSYNLVAKSNALPDLALCDMKIVFDDIADYNVFDLSEIEHLFSVGYQTAINAIRKFNSSK